MRSAKFWLTLWYTLAILTLIWALLSGQGTDHHLARTLQSPSLRHPLGFDAFGRDLLALTLQGSLLSSFFALVALVVSCAFAMSVGTAAAIAPAKFQFFSLRILDLILAFPALLFALAWAAIRGPGWGTLTAALLIGTLPSFTRLVLIRAQEIMAEEYVLASKSVGASPWRIALHHVIPGVASICRVKMPGLFAGALIAEAVLSFLGVGAPIGRDTWGSLLAQGRDYLLEAPHISLGTGIPLVLTVLSLQVLTENHTKASRGVEHG